MNVKIIKDSSKYFDTPIIWDCFRGSYTKLMPTVPHLLECTLTVTLEDNIPKIALLFSMHNTNGFQQDTRRVMQRTNYFNMEYPVEDVSDETLSQYFYKFWDDFILDKDSKYRQDE